MRLLIFLLTFTGVFAFAQPKIKTDATFSAPNYSQQNLELSAYNITYDYKIVKNIKAPDKTKSGVALLQIGDKYNKFVDFNKIKTDSITEKFSHLSTVNSSHFNELLDVSFKSIFRYQIIFNKDNDELTFVDKIHSDSFLYKEKIPTFAWKLDKETKQILGYSVKKASVKYAGRNWTAWYTEDMPIQFGPYKFNGLPGLILEIYDDKEHYHFTANSITQKPEQIYLSQQEKEPIEVKKAEFYKAEKDYHVNAASNYKGVAVDANGKPLVMKEIPYNPIELE